MTCRSKSTVFTVPPPGTSTEPARAIPTEVNGRAKDRTAASVKRNRWGECIFATLGGCSVKAGRDRFRGRHHYRHFATGLVNKNQRTCRAHAVRSRGRTARRSGIHLIFQLLVGVVVKKKCHPQNSDALGSVSSLK